MQLSIKVVLKFGSGYFITSYVQASPALPIQRRWKFAQSLMTLLLSCDFLSTLCYKKQEMSPDGPLNFQRLNF